MNEDMKKTEMLENTQSDNINKEEIQKEAEGYLDELKKLRRKKNIWSVVSIVLTCIFIIVCLFSIYRRYSDPKLWERPTDIDSNQEIIPNDDNNDPQVTTSPSEEPPVSTSSPQESAGHFTIYSVGNVLTAKNGSSEASCDVRNVENSTHDIIASFYIEKSELEANGISTNGIDGDKWLIAETGIFEPGYRITSVQLNALPNGNYLPKGTYNISMTEHFYHHQTREMSSYETSIPMILEVAE